MPSKTNNLIACGECDLLQREPSLPPGGLAECARCGATLFRERPASLDHTLAYAVAAAIVFLLANFYPLMELDAKGIRTSAHLWDAGWRLYEHGMASVAVLVLMTVVIIPGMQLAALLYMLVPLRFGAHPRHLHVAFRIATLCQPWGMVDVFLLGALVSMTKLTQVATVDPAAGLWCVGGYVMLLAAAEAAFEPRELWRRAAELGMPLPAAEEARA